MVVVFYAWLFSLPGGFVGVDIFSVISGFLISWILYRDINAGWFSLANFYRRRVRAGLVLWAGRGANAVLMKELVQDDSILHGSSFCQRGKLCGSSRQAGLRDCVRLLMGQIPPSACRRRRSPAMRSRAVRPPPSSGVHAPRSKPSLRADLCSLVDSDGALLYFDAAHISRAGARHLAGDLAACFDARPWQVAF